MSPDSPPLTQEPASPPEQRRGHGHLLTALSAVLALVVAGGAAVAWFGVPGSGPAPEPAPDSAPTSSPTSSPTATPGPTRDEAVAELLADRGRAVAAGDRAAFLSLVDPAQPGFVRAQDALFDRLRKVPMAQWTYRVTGDGPELSEERATGLPDGSAIVAVRLTYRLDGTTVRTDREQFFTVVPRGGRWLLAGDTDAAASGFETQRDLWDLGPVRVVRGERSLVIADARGAGRGEERRLADESDLAVEDVGAVWRGDWSRRPVVVLPRSQKDMARLIGNDGEGLAQIAAVTTGTFDKGLSRGDRIVVNPAAFGTLGSLGRRVVLGHEMTHVATRATSAESVPIWLSEGFADYVAYDARPVPTSIVAGDVLDRVRDGRAPRRLPDHDDFDAGEGDIAAAYEGAWLACRMIAERYGEQRLVRFYQAMGDGVGTGWPVETSQVLGVTAKELTRDWRQYLADIAAS